MIVRNFGLRQGRKVLARSVSRTCLRCLSTEPTAPTTTVAEPTPSAIPDFGAVRSAAKPTNPALLAKQAAEEAAARIPTEFKAFVELERKTNKLGGVNDPRYIPDRILKDAPEDATLELLMASQAHMGHHPSLWNPATSRYIYGVRAGIHIISLEATLAHLRRAARLVEEVAYHGGLILFVGTRKGQMPIVVRAAELAKACHLFQKWTPGTITNRDQILSGMQMQVVNELDQPLKGFESHLQDRRAILPDLVVCFNPLENYTMLHECGQAGIPTVGVIDTNADPSWVTYSIPANDDSLRTIAVIASVLGRAGERGQKRRFTDASHGVVTWENPRDVRQYMDQAAMVKAGNLVKKMQEMQTKAQQQAEQQSY